MAVAGIIRNVGSDPSSISNIALAALAFFFSVCQWVLKDRTLFNDTYVSLRSIRFSDAYVSCRRSPAIGPLEEESNSLENGGSETPHGNTD